MLLCSQRKYIITKRKFSFTSFVILSGTTGILKHSKTEEDKDVAETSDFHFDIKPEWKVDFQQVKGC